VFDGYGRPSPDMTGGCCKLNPPSGQPELKTIFWVGMPYEKPVFEVTSAVWISINNWPWPQHLWLPTEAVCQAWLAVIDLF